MKSKMESKTKIISLKSCPFCGGKAEFTEAKSPFDDEFVACWVVCTGCRSATEAKFTYGQAADAWNKRQNEKRKHVLIAAGINILRGGCIRAVTA